MIPEERTKLKVVDRKIYLHGKEARIILHKDLIQIGCLDIDLAAAKEVMKMHKFQFGTDEQVYTMQEGK